jgi:hypothetical protein
MARYSWKDTLPEDATTRDLLDRLEEMFACVLEHFSGKEVAFMQIHCPGNRVDGASTITISWYFNEGEDWWENGFPKGGQDILPSLWEDNG